MTDTVIEGREEQVTNVSNDESASGAGESYAEMSRGNGTLVQDAVDLLESGSLSAAFDAATRILATSQTSDDIPILEALRATVHIERSELEDADSHLTVANSSLPQHPHDHRHVNVWLATARAASRRGRFSNSLETARRAGQLILAGASDHNNRESVIRSFAMLMLDLEQTDAATTALGSLEQRLPTNPDNEAVSLRLAVSSGRTDGLPERAVRALRSLPKNASIRSRVEMGTAVSAALAACEKRAEAAVILSTTAKLAEPERFVDSITRYGKAIAPVLEQLDITKSQASTSSAQAPSSDFLRKLLEDVKRIDLTEPASQEILDLDQLAEPLSDREQQILKLLSGTLSNREIGNELYLSVNTVKTHIKKVYAKLGVNRRSEAVAKGRMLGLIDQTETTA